MKKTKPFRIVLTDCNSAFVHCENVGKSRKKFIVSGELTSRDPDQGDLLKIFKSLNEHRTKCVVIGGMAMLLHGFNRATEDIVLLVDKVRANIALLRKALSIMISKNMELFVLQMKFVFDLMRSACGIDFKSDESHIECHQIDGV